MAKKDLECNKEKKDINFFIVFLYLSKFFSKKSRNGNKTFLFDDESNLIKLLVTKKPEIYLFHCKTKEISTFYKLISKGEPVRFFLRVYYPGESGKFIETKTLEYVPDEINAEFFDTI